MNHLSKAYILCTMICLGQVSPFCQGSSPISSSPEGLTPSTGVSPSIFASVKHDEEIPPLSLGPSSYDNKPKGSFSRSNTCPDFSVHHRINPMSRQVSPPPEQICFTEENEHCVHVRGDSEIPDRTASTSCSSIASEGKLAALEDVLNHLALAYEGYQVLKPEKFTPPCQAPLDFLSARGYQKIKKTKHYSVFENVQKKTTTISFAGTNTSNMHIAMGSCLFWQPNQFDAVGRALLPSLFSTVVKKPFTFLMNAAIATSVLSTAATMACWTKGYDILIPGFLASTSLVLSAVMWKNIAPWLFLPVYLKHIHSMVEEINPIYHDALKKGHSISFDGHSLGGQFAQLFAALFPKTKAHCISAPGGGYLQLSILHGWYRSLYGGKSELPSQEVWESRFRLYACDGDPITNLRHENDATHSPLETHEGFGFQEGVDLHRIKNIYIMYYAMLCEQLMKENEKK